MSFSLEKYDFVGQGWIVIQLELGFLLESSPLVIEERKAFPTLKGVVGLAQKCILGPSFICWLHTIAGDIF